MNLGTSRKSKEMDISDETHKVVYSMIPVEAESSNEFRDSDLSPRLSNFIKSGIVPESPLSNARFLYHHTCSMLVSLSWCLG